MAKASKSRGGSKLRKSSRKGGGRKGSRKTTLRRRGRCWRGGANQIISPAGVDDVSMNSSSNQNLSQGTDYQRIHVGQHGGAAVSLASAAPPGYTGMLDDSLRATARIAVLDQSMQSIQGMSDQSGGGRRKSRRSKSRRSKSSRRKGKNMVRRRKRQGGGASSLSHAQDVGAPGMLLSPSQEAQALRGMNSEWRLASDPGAFKPAGM
jgi:hypothetical protein